MPITVPLSADDELREIDTVECSVKTLEIGIGEFRILFVLVLPRRNIIESESADCAVTEQSPGLPTMLVNRVVRKVPTFEEVGERGKDQCCGLPFGEVVIRASIFPCGTHVESAEIFGECFHGSTLK